MSGTSLDGTDIAFCRFQEHSRKWQFSIEHAVTVAYPIDWMLRLKGLMGADAVEFCRADVEYGHYIGRIIYQFLKENHLDPDFIASHGHTVFHQPDKQMTVQIGKGAAIAAETGIPVVCDFRSLDVACGGQGAPLVPIGDQLLFGDYDYCLNIGGFANISFESDGLRAAFDICPANMILNRLAAMTGNIYDHEGTIARSGQVQKHLLNELNNLEYYHRKAPKSLGKEWFDEIFLPLFVKRDISLTDKLRTATEHIAMQIRNTVKEKESQKILVTGGGAFNEFLIELLHDHNQHEWILPEDKIIKFKEALVFAFLGLLRIQNRSNCLKSVTGASKDNIGGVIWMP